jgi:hypothetical protein
MLTGNLPNLLASSGKKEPYFADSKIFIVQQPEEIYTKDCKYFSPLTKLE